MRLHEKTNSFALYLVSDVYCIYRNLRMRISIHKNLGMRLSIHRNMEMRPDTHTHTETWE